MNKCTLTFRSQTAAVKASRYLKKAGILCDVVSVDPSVTSRGCGWGISADCKQVDNIIDKLDGKRMGYGEVLKGGI